MKHNSSLTPLAQKLRKEMTKEERVLWYCFLRDYPVQFRRQVTCGSYIMDFYCSKAKLCVELDGSQHFDPKQLDKELERTHFLEKQGIYVLRVPNNDIWNNLSGVCDAIHELVVQRSDASNSLELL